MIALPFTAQQRYGVLGLGKSGHAAAQALLASGARVLAWDDQAPTREAAQGALHGIEIRDPAQWDWGSLAALVVSPGIPPAHRVLAAARAEGVALTGDIELLWRAAPQARYIAITGTNGKSTTTSLIGNILQRAGLRVEIGGNLGTPALSLAPLGADGTYVLELSSYQLEWVRTTRFGTAILLNITPDHLDHHGTMEAYIAAKMRIFERQQAQDTAIIGVDDAISESIFRTLQQMPSPPRLIPISTTQTLDQGVAVRGGVLHDSLVAPTHTASVQHLSTLQGEHNGQNLAAAYAACRAHGLSPEQIVQAAADYPGLPHRMQWLGEIGRVAYVNDSKATNADAAEKSLRTYQDIYWILGGVAKEGGIAPLAKYFPRIRHAYLIGQASDDFAATLHGHVPFTRCGSLQSAFASASAAAAQEAKNLGRRPVVLLAPACASFDQFANFEARGEAFIACVEAQRNAGGSDGAAA